MSANKYPFKSGSIGYVIMCYGKMRTHRRPFTPEDFRKMKIDKPALADVERSFKRLHEHGFLMEVSAGKFLLTEKGSQYLLGLARKDRLEYEAFVSERNRNSGLKGALRKHDKQPS